MRPLCLFEWRLSNVCKLDLRSDANFTGHRKTCGATDYCCGRLEEGAFTENGELEAGFKGFPNGVQRLAFEVLSVNSGHDRSPQSAFSSPVAFPLMSLGSSATMFSSIPPLPTRYEI
jgi:hypothetical protein